MSEPVLVGAIGRRDGVLPELRPGKVDSRGRAHGHSSGTAATIVLRIWN